MKTLKTICLAVILLLTLSTAGCGARPGFISVSGTRLSNPDGSEFQIRGTNLGNWLNPEGYMFRFPKQASSAGRIDQLIRQMAGPAYARSFWKRFTDNYVTEEDIAYLASTGVNTLRIPFHYKMFTDDEYLCFGKKEDGYRIMDKVVGWCGKYGIKAILDMHDCPSGQTGDNIDDSEGYPWLFTEPEAQDLFVKVWKEIARHYRGCKAILGYDLMNEPVAHYFEDKDSLNAACARLYQRACDEIRKVDTKHILIIGGTQWNGSFKAFDGIDFGPGTMYSCHIYGCPPVKGSIGHFLRVREKSGKPMYMGETGENTDEWVESFRKAMDEAGMGWTFWTYKKLDNTKGFLNIVPPEGWEQISEFAASDRSTFEAIRKARGSQQSYKEILDAYLENCLLRNCQKNEGYIRALGFDPK